MISSEDGSTDMLGSTEKDRITELLGPPPLLPAGVDPDVGAGPPARLIVKKFGITSGSPG